MSDDPQYAAFISYSSSDVGFARKLHRALESYRIPAAMGRFVLSKKKLKNRIYPIFRDREELPSGHLSELIESALAKSGALIVVCSPASARSEWVNREIEYYRRVRPDRIFAIVASTAPSLSVDGSDATKGCFPSALLASDKEVLASDARREKDGFRAAYLKIVAGLVGANLGELTDRDRKQRKRRALTIGAAAAVTGVAVVVGVVSSLEIGRRNAETDVAIQHYEEQADAVRDALTEDAPNPNSGTPSSAGESPAQASQVPTPEPQVEAAFAARSATAEPHPPAPSAADMSAPAAALTAHYAAVAASARERAPSGLGSEFERLHRLHLEALRSNALGRAAVIASQINILLRGQNVSYAQEPEHAEFSFRGYTPPGAATLQDAGAPDPTFDPIVAAEMLDDSDMSAGAVEALIANCTDTSQCNEALSHVLTAPGAVYMHWENAAARICGNTNRSLTRLRGVYDVLQARERQPDWRSWLFAMQIARCVGNPDQELVGAIASVAQHPVHGQAGVSDADYIIINAAETLGAFGPRASSALPTLTEVLDNLRTAPASPSRYNRPEAIAALEAAIERIRGPAR